MNRKCCCLSVSDIYEKILPLFEYMKERIGGPDYKGVFNGSCGLYRRFKMPCSYCIRGAAFIDLEWRLG